MKRLFLIGAMATASIAITAQSLPPSGYYRVQNVRSERYISMIDAYGSLNLTAATANMGALRTWSYSEDMVVTNPATVIYALSNGGDKYDLQAQGTGAMAIVGHVLQLEANADGTYSAFASMSGVTKYLYEHDSDFGDYGEVDINNYSATNKAFRWNIYPISSSDATNYFGIKPNVQVGSAWYKSFFADFNFKFASSGMNAYYVSKVDIAKGVAVYKEISGNVPRATPMFIKCSSEQATNNRLDILTTEAQPISDNVLTGVYFCNTPNEASSKLHEDYVLYDESTMRVLGKTSNGALGFIKAPNSAVYIESGKKYILANTAYLKVPSNAPAELSLMSDEEYGQGSTVTVTAKSYTRVYGDANPTFEYVASDALTGTPELKCEATSTSPVGTYPITVSQGSVTGATVVGVSGTLTITEAPLTVTAQAATREYGEANPALTFTYSGWKNNETEAVLTTKPTATTTATQTSNAGTYDITVGGGAAQNYKFNYVPAKLTVTKAKLTATAADATREYGAANPTFTINYTGFKNGDTEAKLATKPTGTTTANEKTAVGTAAITVSGGADTNYDFEYVNGTLTITKAPLKVKADDKTRPENTDNPALTVTYSGFKNGETEAVLDTKPTVTTTATKDSPAGTYPITVSGGSAKNYTLSYENGTLTVTAGAIILTAKSYTREYGEENPAFTFEVSGTATLKGIPAITCAATKDSPVGEYDIIITKGSVENENVKYVNGKLIITPAKLTVTADDATRVYGNENPELTIKYSGFKNSDNASSLTTAPKATTTATKASEVGTYAITVGNGVASNYTFEYVPGKLTVTEALLTVMANDATRVEGEPNPVFTLTYSGWKNNDTEAVLLEKPVATTDANEHSKAGQYVITVSGGKAKNYKFNYVNGTLTVTAKSEPKVITVDDNENGNEETVVVEEDGTATFVSVDSQNEDKPVDKVEIPETVSDGEESYPVSKIAEGAFEGMTTIETVVIPSTINEIGPNAFAGCTGLTQLYVNIQNPINLLPSAARGMADTTDSDPADPVFSGVNKDVCVLYVPIGSKEKYEAAPVWKTFKNIKETDIQGIDDIITNGSVFNVYNLAGTKVRTSVASLKGLPTGIYIVNGKKVFVK